MVSSQERDLEKDESAWHTWIQGYDSVFESHKPFGSMCYRALHARFLLICCDGVWDVKTNQQASSGVSLLGDRIPYVLLDECCSTVTVLQ